MNILDKTRDLTYYNFPSSQYIQEEHEKSQIYLHHTAGNSSATGVFKYWETTSERVATCIVIAGKPGKKDFFKDGDIVQGFASRHFGYHLGLKEATFQKNGVPYKSLDKISIGIEICNWGQLTHKNGKFYNWVNKLVPEGEVIELETPHRNHKYYHNYTDAQIASTEKLLRYWGSRYNIPLAYNPDIFDMCKRALKGEPGVYTHNSVRYDKVDIYPHPKLVQMLKSL